MRREARDTNPDWVRICEVAAGDSLDPKRLAAHLAGKSPLFARLPDLARQAGVPDEAIARAIEGQYRPIADGLAELARRLERM